MTRRPPPPLHAPHPIAQRAPVGSRVDARDDGRVARARHSDARARPRVRAMRVVPASALARGLGDDDVARRRAATAAAATSGATSDAGGHEVRSSTATRARRRDGAPRREGAWKITHAMARVRARGRRAHLSTRGR